MFPDLSNEEFLTGLLTLASILFLLTIWRDIDQWRGEEQKKKGKRRRLKTQSPPDCELCSQGINLVTPKLEPQQVTPWSKIKHPAGRKKRVNSEEKACPHRCCTYYGIRDAQVHALVSNGWRGKSEQIRQWKCQACGCKFSDRRNTPMYRLKSASQFVAQVMTALAEGVDLSAATRIFDYHHTTISGHWPNRQDSNLICRAAQLDLEGTKSAIVS